MGAQLLHTPAEAAAFTRDAHRAGERVAFVPTMGFLHEGHLSLMRQAAERADRVVVSIFVNPTQFGPNEDFARYPKDFDGDRAKCESAGVDAIFVPEVKAMYPDGFQTYVEVTNVSQGLCGAKRPGHFRGVATVVTKLFAIVRPDIALFGEKDYQQLKVIEALARDLTLGVEVIGRPTVREADGLAMSSRNAYLSNEERQRALALSRGLFAARKRVEQGERRVEPLLETVRAELRVADVREDYVELVHKDTLKPLPAIDSPTEARLLVAGFLGKTRLIDNVALS